ncbi:hypothetical protein SBOR_5079 [Sclerotinia borealis F-4128]|uniref:Uncharacterized protein n=1 Tax=Sclerotinia borealis (strain F-4128) TaxID=1432307 RepID=W9CF94_SCLBF|nr:hypothetical protein SBOR_5079 [Sclerotinia borealis F-4128]
MSSTPIFNAADAAILSQRNLMKPAIGKRRKISSSIVSSDSSSSSGDSEGSGFRQDHFLIVPEMLESEETLQYLGWGADKATNIWRRWVSVTADDTDVARYTMYEFGFLEFALEAVPSSELEDGQEAWTTHMLGWGVAAELVDAIMDTQFADVRGTESAQYWVRDTMSIRYLGLEGLKKASILRDELRQNPAGSFRGNIAVATTTARPSNVPGNLVLYKAISKDRIEKDENGKIIYSSIVSSTPSDFRGYGGTLLYFTPDIEVAKIYRQYIKKRGEFPPVMLQLTLSNAFVESLPPQILLFEDLWKQIIYTCRSRKNLKRDLSGFHKYPLIIAPISRSPNDTISRLRDCGQLSENYVLQVNGKKAIQYAFQGEDVLTQLEEEEGELKVMVD